MSILVTGGAGYIGSHVVRLLLERGDEVVVVDDLSSGIPARLDGVPLVELDLSDTGRRTDLVDVLRAHEVSAVVHFAAKKQVAESVARPAWYYEQNVGGLAGLLLALEEADVRDIVFSSSAAVYGATPSVLLDESTPTVPINPYGATKLVGEQMLAAAAATGAVRATSLRYFNVAGAGWPELADTAVLNLVPMVFERLDAGEGPRIFGDDYPTADGTCIRDYVHVLDLARAHLAALDTVRDGHRVFNVGTGTGSSVREMIDAILEVSGSTIEPVVEPRRAGDPAEVVADPRLIARELGWRSEFGLRDIVESAWAAHVRR
ncbi:UDP-glucose 4-epimerase GalE [Agromyces larvae]|uniref:UDP-glucose 4-epimerase n=1 Tax=Agromyces larvae TaxID=2929802 RepID=A0ABY4C2W5_9MICO|nr:UDP-glucose 4-epimerase GalE [Agromyces larvae]UOE44506.1 UDP-glucose 4-epimerase GalE [Agromyces larvae]